MSGWIESSLLAIEICGSKQSIGSVIVTTRFKGQARGHESLKARSAKGRHQTCSRVAAAAIAFHEKSLPSSVDVAATEHTRAG